MKTDNIFDMLDLETTVADNTVLINTGVSAQKVTQLVMEAIHMNDDSQIIPMKKKSKTAFRLTALIAAVIAASIVTASAMGGFHEAFGSLFAGESSDGIYSGSNLNIQSTNTNVDFLGIAGDQYMAAASMKLTRSNGEKYIDDISNTWISASSPEEINNDYYLYSYIPDTIDYTYPLWLKLKYPDEIDEIHGSKRTGVLNTLSFYFDDCSTISAFVCSSSNYGAIKGETMTASVNSLSAFSVTKVLYDYSEHLDENIDSYGFRTNPDFNNNLTSIVKEYGTGEKNGVRVKVSPETHDIVLAKETPLDIDFSLSVMMNYKNSSNVYKLNNLSQCFKTWQNGAEGKITATPYNMILDVTLSNPIPMTYDNAIDDLQGLTGFLAFIEATREYPEKLVITLENGETIFAYDQGDIADSYNDSENINVIYQLYAENTDDGTRRHQIAINPNEISSIKINDCVIYSK